MGCLLLGAKGYSRIWRSGNLRPMKTRPMLTLDDCRKISAAAEAEAKKNNWIVSIAILDDGGHLLHLIRMDGASPFNARTAIAKGRTAAESRRSSQVWEDR